MRTDEIPQVLVNIPRATAPAGLVYNVISSREPGAGFPTDRTLVCRTDTRTDQRYGACRPSKRTEYLDMVEQTDETFIVDPQSRRRVAKIFGVSFA